MYVSSTNTVTIQRYNYSHLSPDTWATDMVVSGQGKSPSSLSPSFSSSLVPPSSVSSLVPSSSPSSNTSSSTVISLTLSLSYTHYTPSYITHCHTNRLPPIVHLRSSLPSHEDGGLYRSHPPGRKGTDVHHCYVYTLHYTRQFLLATHTHIVQVAPGRYTAVHVHTEAASLNLSQCVHSLWKGSQSRGSADREGGSSSCLYHISREREGKLVKDT